MPYSDLVLKIDTIYKEIVFFRNNLFKLHSGKAGKMFIDELTFWIQQFNRKTKLNKVAMKIFMTLPALLLQKPSAKSKAKQHTETLVRRIQLWREGNIDQLFREVKIIQSSFKPSKKHEKDLKNISKRFSKFMLEGNISAALKLLDCANSKGLLKLSDAVIDELLEKHPETI